MTFPQFSDKHKFDALVSAKQLLEYHRSLGRVPEGPSPEKVIICYQSSFTERVVATYPGHWSQGVFHKIYWLSDIPGVAIANYGIGAPRVALSMEMLIAWGVQNFLSIGTAGAIAPDLKIGDLVGCDRALRDEGTSHHYLPAGRFAHPTDGGAFASKFARKGTTWTLDAFFRHSKEEILSYQKEGILTVEMEASAAFAVGECRGVKIGSGFVISDLLYEEDWCPHFRKDPVEKGLDQLLLMALEK